MSKLEIIKKIEAKRNSKVITYITSDRQGPVGARVAMDIIPIVSEQLRKIGKTDKIDLFLYTAGGDTMVPWRLVSMIREYCDTFSVIIPYKAHSAGTMIALGADEIVMSDLSEISPIDPSTANVFNPVDPANPQNRIPISVEDVIAYFDLAKNKFGIKNDEDLTKIFNKFVEANPQIHPLSLGNVNRTHNLIRLIAKRLLKSHKNRMKDDEIDKVVKYFTEDLYSHTYFVGRKEAKEDLGVKSVIEADSELSDLMSNLYSEYANEMELQNTIWNPQNEIGVNASQNNKEYKVAFVESAILSKVYKLTMEFKRQQVMIPQQTPQGIIQVPQEQVVMRTVEQGWK
ncbi:MAG: hypothetical protein A2431_00535 [Candidatus Zambryskibacteria bacterium RIFOXYC1_FULL_39_10]|uniref:Serine protease n=1 Tax=Candidatus Zambryskibacteria bacterium RIFOXYC1_FULL_39_10 TaxID=1802779 RepID=A0A1G2UZ90_9BACT|nr:MAG: hypothetical protein A2431_00535 [Candidatus Zambryskibacteria bacterium RIFOXYC1_FULL_39_10]OHB15632.1 MAG: hypothetical protein A2605_02395 [Candidatus Zambryskibacteria bacterium RIFOXYD1_FULL_39_35]